MHTTGNIEALMMVFKAKTIQLEHLKKTYGIDLMPMFSQSRKLLMSFGHMVLNTHLPPERWKIADIAKNKCPSWIDWTLFFSRWLQQKDQQEGDQYLHSIGIDMTEYGDPYERLLYGIFAQFYGQEATEETDAFAYENDRHVYFMPDGNTIDLTTPARWATYFCENYERCSIPSLN